MARPREFDEAKAVSQAAAVFWRKGFADTSIGDLEEALSMGRQSIYNAFGDKRTLFLRALEQYYQNANEPIKQAFTGDATGLEAIRRYLESATVILTSSDERLGCFLTRSLIDRGSVDTDVAQKCQKNEKRLLKVYMNALEEALQNGEISASLDINAAAKHLCMHTYGLDVMARSGASCKTLQDSVQFLIERLKA